MLRIVDNFGVILFGKYKGKHISNIIESDIDYISWLKNNITINDPLFQAYIVDL